MAIEVVLPSIMKIGGGAIADAPGILKRLNVKCPLIVTDAFMVRSGLADSLRQQIEGAGVACVAFSGTVPDPTTDAVAAACALSQKVSMTPW